MFRDDIKREFDRITPSEALTSDIAAMMKEEAAKPRKPIYIGAVRAAAAAAAVCLITTASVFAVNTMKGGSSELTAIAPSVNGISDSAAGAVPNKANGDSYDLDGEAYAAEPQPEAIYDTTAAEPAPMPSVTQSYTAPAEDYEDYTEREDGGYDIAAADEEICESNNAPSGDSVSAPSEPDNGNMTQSAGAIGGDGVETMYWLSVTWQLDNILVSYIDAVGAENFEMWHNDTRFDPDFNDYTDIDKFINLYSFKKRYDISDEEFERMLTDANEQISAIGFGALYTDDEINVLAYGTKEEVSEWFANDCTVYHNGRLYTVKWFDTHTVEDYRSEGIPPEKIIGKLDNMMNLENFNNPETREKFDLRDLKAKLDEYINS